MQQSGSLLPQHLHKPAHVRGQPPAASRTIRSSAGIVNKQARTKAKMADHGN